MSTDKRIESRFPRCEAAITSIFVPKGRTTVAQQFTAGSPECLTLVRRSPVGTAENAALPFDRPYGTDLASARVSAPAMNRWAIVERPYGSKSPRRRTRARKDVRRGNGEYRAFPLFLLLLFLAAVVCGCSASKPAEFRLNTEGARRGRHQPASEGSDPGDAGHAVRHARRSDRSRPRQSAAEFIESGRRDDRRRRRRKPVGIVPAALRGLSRDFRRRGRSRGRGARSLSPRHPQRGVQVHLDRRRGKTAA